MTKQLFGAAADNPTSDILLAVVERFGETDSSGNRRAFVGAYRRPEQCDPSYCIIQLVDGEVRRSTIIASERDLGYITVESPGDLPRTDTVVHLPWGEVQRQREGEKTLTWPTLAAYVADPDGIAQKVKEPYTGSERPVVTMSMLEKALDGDVVGDWFRCASPRHGSEDRSLAIKPSRQSKYGFIVHPHSAGDSKEDCRAYVLDALSAVDADEEWDVPEDEFDDEPQEERRKGTWRYALQLWEEARAESTDLVERYLSEARCIDPTAFKDALGTSIRQHPAVLHKKSGEFFPAMLCRVELPTHDEMIALHVTWLLPDGSDRLPKEDQPRFVYGEMRGGVIKLQPYSGGVLMLSEGVESGLSDIELRRGAVKLTTATTWSALSAGNLADLHLPRNARSVKIVGDGDQASRVGIGKALARLQLREKRQVGVIEFGERVDANDYLRKMKNR